MPISKDSFFRAFNADIRGVLRRFFENRQERIPAAVAEEFSDAATLSRMLGLEILEYDGATNEYGLDDRTERFLEEMLGAAEVVQADWLTGLLDELERQITASRDMGDRAKREVFLRKIVRLLRSADSRAQRHLEDIKSAVDIDYRAGSDYEVKLTKLKMHLDRARSFGHAISAMDSLLRNDTFFQLQQGIDLLTLRSRLIRRCQQIGDSLIDIYQRIEEYLNRVLRDYERARKLIRLRGLIERHEHLSSTNIGALSAEASGPWFRDYRHRTLLAPEITDTRPELLERMLRRSGLSPEKASARKVELTDQPLEELAPVIDWMGIQNAFSRQEADLFSFLGLVRVEGRPLSDEERIDGFCAILGNEDWVEGWSATSFEMGTTDGWEFARVFPASVHQIAG